MKFSTTAQVNVCQIACFIQSTVQNHTEGAGTSETFDILAWFLFYLFCRLNNQLTKNLSVLFFSSDTQKPLISAST